MPEVKIKIGAAVDQSMRTVFRPLMQAATEARKHVQKEFSSLAVGMKTGFSDGGRTAHKVFADTSKAGEDMSRDLERQAQKRARIAEQESKREWSAYSREAKRAFQETEKEAAKNARALNRFAERTSHRATRFFMPNMPIMSVAHRAGAEALRGLGVDTSIDSLVRRGVGIEQSAVDLSNRGHVEGAEGANGGVVDPKALEAEARKTGRATAVNPEEILAAGREFVGLTGDLDLWRKIMPSVVAQTKALGGNQADAAKAAGEFAAHIGDVPDKQKAITDLMRVAAGQGKIGGVDFGDFAKYAAKVAAPAALFKGDQAQNIGKLTALAEIAKMHGGASSAAMAFGSIDSFTNTLKKPARLKSIAALIGDKNGQFADDQHSILKDPLELAKQLIVAGSKDKSGKSGLSSLDRVQSAIGDARSMKAITGLQVRFNEAGGGQAGLDAMNAELKKFSGAIQSTDEISRGLAAALNTSESKAERFNQKLEAITHGAMEKFLPALEQLEIPALKVAGYLGELATSIANNPGTAIVEAIGLVIARAGIESAFRHGIETIIKDVGGATLKSSATGAAGAAGGTGLVGLFTSAAVIAALAYAIEQAGEAAINHFANKQVADQQAAAIRHGNQGAEIGALTEHARQGTYTPADESANAAIEKELASRIKRAESITEVDKRAGGAPTGVMAAIEQAMAPERNKARQDAQQLTLLKAEMTRVHAMLELIHNGTLKVMVTNQEMPKAPPAGPQGGK
jgi:hypothetical protein